MITFDARSAECLVFTYKQGLLAAVAHDLKIRVTQFSLAIDERTRAIDGRFDATSLRVVCAMQDGTESPGTLTPANKREIEANIVEDVLESATYPEIRFISTAVQEAGESYVVKGKLALHGRQRQISARVQRQGDRYLAEVRLQQPDFGIRPYTALFGTLKVKAQVTVRVSVPTTPPA